VLDKDQRILLKLKRESQIDSCDGDGKKPKGEFYKKKRTDLLLERYVEQIQ
jgi:hypothetical protein